MDPIAVFLRSAITSLKDGQMLPDCPKDGGDENDALKSTLAELCVSMRQRFTESERLFALTEKINAGLHLEEVLDHVFEAFHPLIPFDRISLALIQDEGSTARVIWARTTAPELTVSAGYSRPLAGSSLEEIIRTGKPRIIADLEAYQFEHPNSASALDLLREGVRSSLTCPLISQGKPVGFLFFSSLRPHAYDNAHVELFSRIANQIALAVERSLLIKQLVEANEVKNRFLGIAAHDLRSPITIIKGFLSLLRMGTLGEIPDKQLDVINRMMAACDSMLSLIGDLVDVSAIESGHLKIEVKEVDLIDLLDDFLASSRLLAEAKSIGVQMELDDGLPKVLADPNRIDQVLRNLMGNAIKFSRRDTVIAVQGRRLGDCVEIAVADQGQGIPAHEMERLFAEFHRASTQPTEGEKSTGLGLAIARRIVEALGGRIWVESREGVGSTFRFTIPVATETASGAGA